MKLGLLFVFLLMVSLVSASYHAQESYATPPPLPTVTTTSDNTEVQARMSADAAESEGIEGDDIGIADSDEAKVYGWDYETKEEVTGTEIEDIGVRSLPEVDDEVMDGNPDRPLVVGRMPNAEYDEMGRIISQVEVDDSGNVILKGKKILENDKSTGLFYPPVPGVAKKLREIVVVGSKIREAKPVIVIPEEDAGINPDDWIVSRAAQIALEDENVVEVSFRETDFTFVYRKHAKLFGFLPIRYNYEAHVDDEGRVKVRFPWWLAISSDNADETTIAVEEAAAGQQQSMQMMSNIAKAFHDTGMAIIRKIG